MSYILTPFMILSGSGLILSLLVHIFVLIGIAVPYPEYIRNLHFGIFIVWVPTVLVAGKLSKDVPQKDFWRAALRGCPKWMKNMTYVFGIYAMLNFISLFILDNYFSPKGSRDIVFEFRMASGHWMAFYSVAFSVLYSAIHVSGVIPERRCRNGHVVSMYAKFCQECGAPVVVEGINPSTFGT